MKQNKSLLKEMNRLSKIQEEMTENQEPQVNPEAIIPLHQRRELQRRILVKELAEGKTFRELCEQYSEEFELSPNHLWKQIVKGLDEVYSEDYIEKVRLINSARLDFLYQKSLEIGDIKSAIKAVECQSRLLSNQPSLAIASEGELVVKFNF